MDTTNDGQLGRPGPSKPESDGTGVARGMVTSILIGVILAGLFVLFVFSLELGGCEGLATVLKLYPAFGTLGTLFAGWLAVALSGRSNWLAKGALACPTLYVFLFLWIVSLVTTGDPNEFDYSSGVVFLIPVLVSMLGAAGCCYLQTRHERAQSKLSERQQSE